MLKGVYNWMGSRVYSEYADVLLGLLFYLEAIFFIPTDPMLIFYCFERKERSYWYATIATISSVLGGITAYCIGYLLRQTAGESIIHSSFISYIISPHMFHYLCEQYKQHEHIAILIAGFTPIPYKAATLTAGFCSLSLISFTLFSFIARGARFYLFAFIINKWGKKAQKHISSYFNIILLLMIFVIFLVTWYLRL